MNPQFRIDVLADVDAVTVSAQKEGRRIRRSEGRKGWTELSSGVSLLAFALLPHCRRARERRGMEDEGKGGGETRTQEKAVISDIALTRGHVALLSAMAPCVPSLQATLERTDNPTAPFSGLRLRIYELPPPTTAANTPSASLILTAPSSPAPQPLYQSDYVGAQAVRIENVALRAGHTYMAVALREKLGETGPFRLALSHSGGQAGFARITAVPLNARAVVCSSRTRGLDEREPERKEEGKRHADSPLSRAPSRVTRLMRFVCPHLARVPPHPAQRGQWEGCADAGPGSPNNPQACLTIVAFLSILLTPPSAFLPLSPIAIVSVLASPRLLPAHAPFHQRLRDMP